MHTQMQWHGKHAWHACSMHAAKASKDNLNDSGGRTGSPIETILLPRKPGSKEAGKQGSKGSKGSGREAREARKQQKLVAVRVFEGASEAATF